MENFIVLISDVWTRGFLGINLGAIISSLGVIILALLFRGFIISVIINSLSRLAAKTESKIDDEILNALKSKKIHHAWLICGRKGIGKATLAWKMARTLLTINSSATNSTDINSLTNLNVAIDNPIYK